MKLSKGRSSDFRHEAPIFGGSASLRLPGEPCGGSTQWRPRNFRNGEIAWQEIAYAGHSGGTVGESHPTSLFAALHQECASAVAHATAPVETVEL